MMTLAKAFAVAAAELENPIRFTPAEEANWNEARRVLLSHNYCPNCACHGHRQKLSAWQPGNYWNYAGRECPDCEEFVVCGEQPEYESAATEWRGDADPGL